MKAIGTWAATLLAVIASGLFVFTGIEKFQDIDRFREILASHQLVPIPMVGALTYLVPTAEVLVGVASLRLLASRRPSSQCLRLVAVMFAVFGLYATVLVAKPPPTPTPCGCSIRSENANWANIALGNCGLAVVCALAGAVRFETSAKA